MHRSSSRVYTLMPIAGSVHAAALPTAEPRKTRSTVHAQMRRAAGSRRSRRQAQAFVRIVGSRFTAIAVESSAHVAQMPAAVAASRGGMGPKRPQQPIGHVRLMGRVQ